ncbi:MAG: hypothetical protein ACK5AZ_26035 [Bryobacteraceae bacterium]
MTSSPLMLIMLVGAAIIVVEALQWAVRSLVTVLPVETTLVVAPLAIRLGMVAFLTIRVVRTVQDVQRVIATIETVGRW